MIAAGWHDGVVPGATNSRLGGVDDVHAGNLRQPGTEPLALQVVARLDRAHADAGTRLKAAIQEAGTPPPPWGLVGQSASLDPNVHSGVWALSGSYGAFTPFIHLAARV